jgi:hypothetical protein
MGTTVSNWKPIMFCVVKSYSDGRISPQFLNSAPRRRLSSFKPLINAKPPSMRSGETKTMCRRPATAASTGPHYPGLQPFDVASRPWRSMHVSMHVTSLCANSGVSRNDPETLGDDHASSGDEPGHWCRIGFPFQRQLRRVHTSFRSPSTFRFPEFEASNFIDRFRPMLQRANTS